MSYHVEFDLDFKRNKFPGKFIVLEGIEASGKTTQVKKLGEKIPNAILTKNPTDNNAIGVFIRNKVLAGKANIPPAAYQYLFAADREIQQADIIDLLRKGNTVISDRYLWSSVAYGIADRQDMDYKDWNNITLVAYSALSMYHQFLLPDLTVYLDIPIEESLKRIKGSKKHSEIYDNHKMNIKIEKGYKWLIKKFPKEFTIVDGDGDRSEEEITNELANLINNIKK